MKHLVAFLALLTLHIPTANAYTQRFDEARQAYDTGRFLDAIAHYEAIVANGATAPELFYNLANAEFKAGRISSAVAHYRRAWYATPRDPDLRVNLEFALQAAGVVPPKISLMTRAFTQLSAQEWRYTAMLVYLATMGLLIVAVLSRRLRRVTSRMALATGLLLLPALTGIGYWHRLTRNPEWVAANAVTARYAPIEKGTPHFTVPASALLRQCGEETQGWVPIRYDDKKGWVKKAQITRVSP